MTRFFKDADGKPGQEKEMKLEPNHYREVMDELFREYPAIFSPRPSYDGRKNMYSSKALERGDVSD